MTEPELKLYTFVIVDCYIFTLSMLSKYAKPPLVLAFD